ncbi:MAG: glycosyltransferase family 2 protein [Actinomycetota bacterium]|jgi:glycosyltransferase involved in cell wall biosynthesis|nr:glycosyltransferase family 2 protein [Actinomycetota bacterium]MDQ3905559.1 glycosyltransferase family 2 protein [Actinomycetota bacterium]
MSRVISVITAAHTRSVPYLLDAYDSLVAQELPGGWSWEWLLQEDGQSGAVATAVPDDPRISVGSARRGGPGVTRTMAMARAQGVLVRNLDADDKLLPGAIARDIMVLTERPTIGWTTSRLLNWLPDGKTEKWKHQNPDQGVLKRGTILESWRSNDWFLPIHPVTMCIRRDLLFALGGWMALPCGEDTGLLIAASVAADGYFIDAPSLLYRNHPHQMTAQVDHADGLDGDRRHLIAARGDALRCLLGN